MLHNPELSDWLKASTAGLFLLGVTAAADQITMLPALYPENVVGASAAHSLEQFGSVAARHCLNTGLKSDACPVSPEVTTTSSTPSPPEVITTKLPERISPARTSRSMEHAPVSVVTTAPPMEGITVLPPEKPLENPYAWNAPMTGDLEDLGTFEATCYELTSNTASGPPAGNGGVAIDPKVIPMHSRLIIEGYGPATTVDTGGDIKGRRIDVWKSAGCKEWGRRQVRVIKVNNPQPLPPTSG